MLQVSCCVTQSTIWLFSYCNPFLVYPRRQTICNTCCLPLSHQDLNTLSEILTVALWGIWRKPHSLDATTDSCGVESKLMMSSGVITL